MVTGLCCIYLLHSALLLKYHIVWLMISERRCSLWGLSWECYSILRVIIKLIIIIIIIIIIIKMLIRLIQKLAPKKLYVININFIFKAVIKWLSKVIPQLRVLFLVSGFQISHQFLNQWEGKPIPSNWRGVWNKALSDFWCNVKFS